MARILLTLSIECPTEAETRNMAQLVHDAVAAVPNATAFYVMRIIDDEPTPEQWKSFGVGMAVAMQRTPQVKQP